MSELDTYFATAPSAPLQEPQFTSAHEMDPTTDADSSVSKPFKKHFHNLVVSIFW